MRSPGLKNVVRMPIDPARRKFSDRLWLCRDFGCSFKCFVEFES